MNYPSRTDPEAVPNGWNQNPAALALDTNSDANGIANLRLHHDHRIPDGSVIERIESPDTPDLQPPPKKSKNDVHVLHTTPSNVTANQDYNDGSREGRFASKQGPVAKRFDSMWATLKKFAKFVGPGFMIAVAYIDPGQY